MAAPRRALRTRDADVALLSPNALSFCSQFFVLWQCVVHALLLLQSPHKERPTTASTTERKAVAGLAPAEIGGWVSPRGPSHLSPTATAAVGVRADREHWRAVRG